MMRQTLLVLLLLSASAVAQEQVPFDLVENIIVAKGAIHGHEATWLVDTGANQTIVTPAAARSAGLASSDRVTASLVSIGGASVRNLTVVVDDPEVAQFMRQGGVDYAGILGTTFLERFIVTIDYESRHLSFAHPSTELKDPGIPFTLRNGLIFVATTINDRGPANLLLDCGAQMTVLRPKAIERLKLENLRKPPHSSDPNAVLLNAIRVGDVSVSEIHAVIHEPKQGDALDQNELNCDGFLGYTWLSRFRLSIDYRRRRLHLHAAPPQERPLTASDPPAPPPKHPSLGLVLDDTTVLRIDPGSAAEQAGFKPGDTILRIGNQRVRFIEEIRAILEASPPGKTLTFTIQRAEESILLSLSW